MGATEERIQTFLAALPEGARDYYKLIFDIIEIINPPIDELHGLASFSIFKSFAIYMEDGRAIGLRVDPYMGSQADIAEAIVVVFYEANPNKNWWHTTYIIRAGNPATTDTVDQFLRKLRASGKVKAIEQDLLY
jgi:hypothetical protein